MGAWSMPIKSVAGTILGTLGTYFRDHRTPTPEAKTGVEHLAATAALVLTLGLEKEKDYVLSTPLF